MAEAKRQGSAERSRRYRERKRAQGLRLVRVWVPDHRSPAYEARLAEQAAAIAGSPEEREALRWIEQAADQRGWEWGTARLGNAAAGLSQQAPSPPSSSPGLTGGSTSRG
jgi:hypothetical protein